MGLADRMKALREGKGGPSEPAPAAATPLDRSEIARMMLTPAGRSRVQERTSQPAAPEASSMPATRADLIDGEIARFEVAMRAQSQIDAQKSAQFAADTMQLPAGIAFDMMSDSLGGPKSIHDVSDAGDLLDYFEGKGTRAARSIRKLESEVREKAVEQIKARTDAILAGEDPRKLSAGRIEEQIRVLVSMKPGPPPAGADGWKEGMAIPDPIFFVASRWAAAISGRAAGKEWDALSQHQAWLRCALLPVVASEWAASGKSRDAAEAWLAAAAIAERDGRWEDAKECASRAASCSRGPASRLAEAYATISNSGG